MIICPGYIRAASFAVIKLVCFFHLCNDTQFTSEKIKHFLKFLVKKTDRKMYLAFLVLFAVLSSNGCFNQVNARSVPNDTKVTFVDLNPDVHYEILDMLETEDIVSMMDAIPSLSPGGKSIYLKRNKDYEVYIWDAEKAPRADYTRRTYPLRITFRSYDVILNILKHFGGVMQQIYVDNRIIHSMDKALTISRHINQYTSESLIKLSLGIIKKDTFAQFTVPFKLVEELSFGVSSNKIDINIGSLPLNQQFPELRRLNMELWGNINYNFIDLKFPHLEHLYLIIGKNAWNRKDQFESLIRKNSEIRSFGVEYCPTDYIKVLEQILPNIENLTLSQLNTNESIHFEHVKNFHYIIPQVGYFPEAIKNLSLPSLESLKLENSYDLEHDTDDRTWHTFFQKHKNITRLHYVNRKFTCDDLMDAGLDFPNFANLTEMILECSYETNKEKFINFVKKHDKLVKFQLIHPYKNDETENIREQLKDEWNSNDYNDELNVYLFEKKALDPYVDRYM